MSDGKKLRAILMQHQISQKKLATALGTHQPMVSRFCNSNRRGFRRETIPRMNDALNRLTGLNQVWFPEKDSEDDDRK